MKISTRLKLNTWFSLGLILLMVLSLSWSFWEKYKADNDVLLVRQIEKVALERIILRDDWIIHRGDRASAQWYAETKTLQGLLESASRKFANNEVKDLLRSARDDFGATSSLLSAIIENYKKEQRNAKGNPGFTETESRLLSQVFLRAYSLNDSIRRLGEYAQKAAIDARNKGIILIIIFVMGGVTAMVINSTILNNIVTKQVASLAEGMWIMGDGNLDHHIDVAGDDELAYLARSSNAMAARLQQSYVSVDNLRQEVAERKRAEENIRMLSLHQQSLITAIPDIVMEVDVNKRYTWANRPGVAFFGEDVVGKEADSYFVREQNTYDVVQPIFNGNEDVIYLESWQRRKDGQERLLAWWCRALKDVKGNVTGALSSARDITESKLVEEEVKKLNEELEKRVAERTAELMGKTVELERINKVFVDRELRMRELKAHIAALEKKT